MLKFRTYADLRKGTLKLASLLAGPYCCVVGIPRSGMIPATQLALLWNIPCYSLDEFCAGVLRHSASFRAQYPTGDILLVDDSYNTGRAMDIAKASIIGSDHFKYMGDCKVVCTAVYVEDGFNRLEAFSEIVPLPRLFEWNMFHHPTLTQWCASDIDGVLCPDPPAYIDEVANEQGYANWIDRAPCIRPASQVIHTLVTARLEKYRSITEEWLRRNGYEWCHLHMCQDKDVMARRIRRGHAKDKAEHYKNTPGLKLFVESSRWQAEFISQSTGKPVFCTDTEEYLA